MNEVSIQQRESVKNSVEANHINEYQDFEARLEHALADEQMHAALERFAPSWRTSRKSVFDLEENEYGPDYSFEHMRSLLRQAKRGREPLYL